MSKLVGGGIGCAMVVIGVLLVIAGGVAIMALGGYNTLVGLDEAVSSA